MAANDIRAGGAFIELSTKNSAVLKGLQQVETKLKALGGTITSIGTKMAAFGGAVTAGLLVAAQRFASMGDEISKASQRTGVSAENFSKLKYAADQSGSSAEELDKSMLKMSKTLVEAQQGSSSAKAAFSQLGISIDDLTGKSPDEQLLIVSEALSKVTDANKRAAYATDIFGKSGANLLPMMADGRKGIEELMKRAEDLGLVIGEDDSKAATRFGDVMSDLWKQVQMVTFHIGAAVSQALQPFAEAATKVMATVINWIKENRRLVVIVLAVASGVLAAGVAFIAIGTTLAWVATAIGGFIAAFAMVGSVIGALLSPIALVVAAIVGLGIYFGYAAKAGNAAISFLSEKFNALKDIAGEAFSGIADALAAGDIALAAKILWGALQLAWLTGTEDLQKTWIKFKEGFVQVSALAMFGTLTIWETVKASLLTSFENTTAVLSMLWDGFIGSFTMLWNKAVNVIVKGLNWIKGLWDDTFDTKVANEFADKILEAQNKANLGGTLTKITNRELAKQKELAQIEKDKADAIKAAANTAVGTILGGGKNASDDIAELEKRKKALQDELDALRAKAKKERDLSGGGWTQPKHPDKPNADDITAGISKAAAAGSGAIGLFNVAALQSLMSGSPVDRIAKATEDTAKNTNEIRKKAGIVFA